MHGDLCDGRDNDVLMMSAMHLMEEDEMEVDGEHKA
jgi:hypothetical protein